MHPQREFLPCKNPSEKIQRQMSNENKWIILFGWLHWNEAKVHFDAKMLKGSDVMGLC